MKSLLQKTVYAGLGLLGTGKQTINQLGRELSKKANVSEKEGEKLARQLRSRSEKAIKSLRKTLDTEVNRVVHALHVATRDDVAELAAKAKPVKKPRRRRPAKPKPAV
jgi:polyhydroxyalkanoate synthesis regulator phasin